MGGLKIQGSLKWRRLYIAGTTVPVLHALEQDSTILPFSLAGSIEASLTSVAVTTVQLMGFWDIRLTSPNDSDGPRLPMTTCRVFRV